MPIRRGDLFWVDLNPVKGSEQAGRRPVVVIQNDVGNEVAPTVIVAPITTKSFTKHYPINVQIARGVAGLKENSTILLSQIREVRGIPGTGTKFSGWRRGVHRYPRLYGWHAAFSGSTAQTHPSECAPPHSLTGRQMPPTLKPGSLPACAARWDAWPFGAADRPARARRVH